MPTLPRSVAEPRGVAWDSLSSPHVLGCRPAQNHERAPQLPQAWGAWACPRPQCDPWSRGPSCPPPGPRDPRSTRPALCPTLPETRAICLNFWFAPRGGKSSVICQGGAIGGAQFCTFKTALLVPGSFSKRGREGEGKREGEGQGEGGARTPRKGQERPPRGICKPRRKKSPEDDLPGLNPGLLASRTVKKQSSLV